MGKKKIEAFLDTAISEINHSFNKNKSAEVRKFYLENAIRFIEYAIKDLDKLYEPAEVTKQIELILQCSQYDDKTKLKRIGDLLFHNG